MPRVLVVDDEKDVVEYISGELHNAGYETAAAFDGVEAVLRVLDEDWDVVMMDIRMPKLDGINALRIMRRVAPSIPVIIFTGQAGEGEMISSTRLGASTCLRKPISPDDLAITMQAVLPTP